LKVPEPTNMAGIASPGADAKPREHATHDLRGKTVRGAMASGIAQVTSLVLRTGSMIVLARLLFPRDFGLFGMVTAVTGFLSMFRDFGLSMASVTRVSVTEDQLSTLFWVNVAVGAIVALLCAAIAPVLVGFYREPRLFLITIALAVGFLFNGAAAQHRAILQRHMQFGTLAVIDTVALVAGIVAAVSMAAWGFGYWALVVMTVLPQASQAVGAWIATGWIPGLPRRQSGVRSMLWYGGTITVNGLIMYVAYNVDKVLIGRFWGADALGIYGRAYQLISLPSDSLNSTVAQVAFPALSRIQADAERLRSYFLQGYGLFFAVVVPITVASALFAEDIVRVFLGPKWQEAASIFRLLAPAMLVFAVMNPFGWLMMSTGYSVRSMKIALMIAPCVILGYSIGLTGGTHGVALAFSVTMLCLMVPVVAWSKHGTLMTTRDILSKVTPPLVSALAGGAAAFVMRGYVEQVHSPFWRLVCENGILFGVYLAILLFVMKQSPIYVKLLQDMKVWPFRMVPKPAAAA
jgi:PST family polysaccharide transporter